MENRQYNLAQLVEKINGNVYPAGESDADRIALNNLEQLGDMVNEFVSEIYGIWSRNHSCDENSRIQAAKKAKNILFSLQDYMPESNPELARKEN